MEYREAAKGCLITAAIFLVFGVAVVLILMCGCSGVRTGEELPERDEIIIKTYMDRQKERHGKEDI